MRSTYGNARPKAGCVLYRKLLCRDLCKARKDSWGLAGKLGWPFLVSHLWGLWGWFLGRLFSKRSVPIDLSGAQRWLLLCADLMQAAGSEKHTAFSVLQHCRTVTAEQLGAVLHWLCSATQRMRGAKKGLEKPDVVLYEMMVTSLSVPLKSTCRVLKWKRVLCRQALRPEGTTKKTPSLLVKCVPPDTKWNGADHWDGTAVQRIGCPTIFFPKVPRMKSSWVILIII